MNSEYSFAKELNDIVKERWHALEFHSPTFTVQNELKNYANIVPDEKFISTESMDVRYDTEYLIEFVDLIHSHYDVNVDVSAHVHMYRIILSNFEPFARMMTYLESLYGDEAYILDEKHSKLTVEQETHRSDVVKECIAEYMKYLPETKSWLLTIEGTSLYDIFVTFVVVFMKMIILEPFVEMVLEDGYEDDEEDYED